MDRLHPSTIAMNRTHVLAIGKTMAKFFEDCLKAGGYVGPVAVAGGYLRDVGLMRQPKDMDIFIDGGHCKTMDEARKLAEEVSKRVSSFTLSSIKVMPCYGTWAEDVAMVAEVRGDFHALWPTATAPVPEAIDLIVLLRPELIKAGYQARLVNDAWNQESFLSAVLARVDLRLNAIGATPTHTEANPHWDFDAYYHRLVIQHSRKDGSDRISRRILRLLATKYQGWDIGYEQADGSVSNQVTGGIDQGASPAPEGPISHHPDAES